MLLETPFEVVERHENKDLGKKNLEFVAQRKSKKRSSCIVNLHEAHWLTEQESHCIHEPINAKLGCLRQSEGISRPAPPSSPLYLDPLLGELMHQSRE
ncbi:hypothetical protein LDENG_00022570 [Lucifuga dentata]|nr:hypothetical protein LDENG_00022570 [Lucifuga dentata]